MPCIAAIERVFEVKSDKKIYIMGLQEGVASLLDSVGGLLEAAVGILKRLTVKLTVL
jgi:hypothetical protein